MTLTETIRRTAAAARKAIESSRLTKGEIARRAGITPQTMSYFLSGTRNVSPATLDDICRAVERTK